MIFVNYNNNCFYRLIRLTDLLPPPEQASTPAWISWIGRAQRVTYFHPTALCIPEYLTWSPQLLHLAQLHTGAAIHIPPPHPLHHLARAPTTHIKLRQEMFYKQETTMMMMMTTRTTDIIVITIET